MVSRARASPGAGAAIGKRLLMIRKSTGHTRKAFAEFLDQSEQRWYYYEGGRVPDVETLVWLHESLGINLNWLLSGTGPKAMPGRDVLGLNGKR